jgi:predicted alpha/beta-hydrolase family hydrolase
MQRLLLFAHGAGAPSNSTWMRRWARGLAGIGKVVTFDYPYMREERRRPDPHAVLVAAHAAALDGQRRLCGPRVLVGKSMGGRIGCHLALEREVAALVCLGYPLVSPGKSRALRDEVLVALRTPILFVQGTRDRLCPLAELDKVRRRMVAPNELYVVESGDHSLVPTRSWIKEHATSDKAVEAAALAGIEAFVARFAPLAGC